MNSSGLFDLSAADNRPMYLQLMDQIKHRIAVGDWPPGHGLPSIRRLAADLRVSVITVKRTYLELEREGTIVTQHGKGSFVAERSDVQKELLFRALKKQLARAAELAKSMGVDPDELRRLLDEEIERESPS